MSYKSAGLLFLIFLCISCADTSHNILPATPSGNGILVVPHLAKGQGSGFAYGYVLLYKPEAKTRIEIVPHRAKKMIIFKDFPPGSYSIDEMVIFPNSTGQLVAFSEKKTRRIPFIIDFTISPGKITILDYMLCVETKTTGASGFRESCRLVHVGPGITESIKEEIKTLANYDKWELDY